MNGLQFWILIAVFSAVIFSLHLLIQQHKKAVKEFSEGSPFKDAIKYIRMKYNFIVYTKRVYPDFNCVVVHPFGWDEDHTGKIEYDEFLKLFVVVPNKHNRAICDKDLLFLSKIVSHLNRAMEIESKKK